MPIPRPILDSNKINISDIYDQYVNLYSGDTNNYSGILPWHYVIEFYKQDYLIYNTRPLDMQYVYTTAQMKLISSQNDSIILNDFTSKFLSSQNEAKNMIHVLIIGNSNYDVYNKKLYSKLGEYIIAPLARLNKFAPMVYTNIHPLNMGKHFLPNILIHHLKN